MKKEEKKKEEKRLIFNVPKWIDRKKRDERMRRKGYIVFYDV